MARRRLLESTIKALFAKSGNQCAFPNCSYNLVNDKNIVLCDIAHIEAAEPGGERYNPNSTDEDRRSYENLILLCKNHHAETNDVEEYSVEKMQKMKKEHEDKYKEDNFEISSENLRKLEQEFEQYWAEVAQLNAANYDDLELAMEVDSKKDFLSIMDSLHETFDRIEAIAKHLNASSENLYDDFIGLLKKKEVDLTVFDSIKYYENPFVNRDWETHNLALPNWLQRLKIDLAHVEIKYLEEYLKINAESTSVQARLNKTKLKLKEYARTALHVD